MEYLIQNPEALGWNDIKAALHLPLRGGENRFKLWLDDTREQRTMNLFDPKNHEKVLDLYKGANEIYENAVEKCPAEHKEKYEWGTKYTCLVWAIQTVKFDRVLNANKRKEREHELDVTGGAGEGNHRLASALNCLFLCKFDPTKARVKTGTITTKWLIESLMTMDRSPNREVMEKNLEDVNLYELRENAMKTNGSAFNEIIEIDVNYGVGKDEFKRSGMTMEDQQKTLINESEKYMKVKLDVTRQTRTKQLADKINHILERAERNSNLDKDEVATWSANGSIGGKRYYNEFRMPKSTDDPSCGWMMHWDEAAALKANPTRENFDKWCRRMPMGVAKKQAEKIRGRTVWAPTGKSVFMPTKLNYQNTIEAGFKTFEATWRKSGDDDEKGVSPVRPPASAKKKTKSPKQKSPARPVDMVDQMKGQGESHFPCMPEEGIRAGVIAFVHDTICKANEGKTDEEFETSPSKLKCQAEIDYMMRLMAHTEYCANFGREIDKNKWINTAEDDDENSDEWWVEYINFDKTLIHPDNRHMAATLWVAEAVIAMLRMPLSRSMGIVAAITNAQNDFDRWDKRGERAFVNIIGEKFLWKRRFILYLWIILTCHFHFRITPFEDSIAQ